MDTVGFIGLGVMGRPMAKHILAKGFPVVVYNRSRAAIDDLVAAGYTLLSLAILKLVLG